MLLVMLICGGLISGMIIPEGWIDLCVMFSGVIGGVVGSVVTSKMGGFGGLGYGLAAGIILSMLLIVSGILIYSTFDVAMCCSMSGSCICGGGIGGWVIGGRYKRKRQQR